MLQRNREHLDFFIDGNLLVSFYSSFLKRFLKSFSPTFYRGIFSEYLSKVLKRNILIVDVSNKKYHIQIYIFSWLRLFYLLK